MQSQTSLPSIRAILDTPIGEVGTQYRVPSPTYPTEALAAHNKNAFQHAGNIRSLISPISPPESPDLKSAGYQSYNCYGYDDRSYFSSTSSHPVHHTYEDPCNYCVKPTPVYSSPVPTYSQQQYVQPRYVYAPLSPFDRKPTAPSLPRLNTILESLTPLKHFPHKGYGGQLSPTGSSSGNRYQCPYCSKRFSRPSSLRIHTYSHTGEKPFVCTEPGCGRKFSVQSNMRRHLRVHRLGRPVKKTRYDGEVEGYKMLSPAAGILRSY